MTLLLDIADLSLRFGGVQALAGIGLGVAAGEVVAVIGPNGAGKTSLFNAITGYVRPSGGRVAFRGERIDGMSPHAISAKGLRRTFQNGGLFGELTVLENVLAGLHAEIPGSLPGIVFGFRSARAAERAAVAKARALLGLMDLGALADRPAKDLSGGQQRMVEIVRALATNPPLLLLDEPAVGLSPPMRTQLGAIIRRLAEEEGLAILLIEHAIELVMSVADRIVVLNYGEKIADGPPASIRADKQVLEAYLGHA